MYKIYFTFLFFIFFNSVFSQKLHLILVCSTGESDIRTAELNNRNRMLRIVKRISDNTGMDLEIYEFIDDDVKEDNIKDAIYSLTCDSLSTVIFFYGGHGVNVDRNSNFPRFILKGKTGNLRLDNIHNNLKTKGAKNVITIADCCNFTRYKSNDMSNLTDEKIDNSINLTSNNSRETTKLKNNYSKLFLINGLQTDIITSSSKKGQFSKYNTLFGGYFTMALETAMFKIIHREENLESISWKKIFELASEITRKAALLADHIQNPQYVINYSNNYEISSPIISSNNIDTIFYTVKQYDNLTKIARINKIDLKDLRLWNNKQNTDHIELNEKLIIIKNN